MAKARNTFKKSDTEQSNKANTKTKKSKKIRKKVQLKLPIISNRVKNLLGFLFLFIGLFLLLSFVSYLFTWKADQDQVFQFSVDYFKNPNATAENLLGKIGAYTAHQFFYNWIGVSSFFIPIALLIISIYLFTKKAILRFPKLFLVSLFGIIIVSLLSSYFFGQHQFPWSGAFGTFTNTWLEANLGKIGTGLLYLLSIVGGLLFYFDYDPFQKKTIRTLSTEGEEEFATSNEDAEFIELKQATNTEELSTSEEEAKNSFISNPEEDVLPQDINPSNPSNPSDDSFEVVTPTAEMEEFPKPKQLKDDDNLGLEIESVKEEKQVEHYTIDTEFDPTLELRNFEFPSLELLETHGESNITINREELEKNKDQIVQTLKNYKIDISKIKATVGPTVTLYEIVPAPGIRISKIKNLEDDIALSLAALGIRIIAPIPGKGTIGIEVPNTHPNIVSMKSMLASEKFANSKADLPVAIGKTISNENYIGDLAKMPHLLIAGATGQGKSVGINALLVSLLYKKHPSELKFVLVDPKKVELSIYSKIEKHYLAKLPGEGEPIITDTAKVVNTLNSLCIEMDERYDLLKDAFCRNIKEYNKKFKERKLNPEKGHRFLPYIVLVVDEFADLIMTAGKEVESPIARLAQLARAVGIHLIIATQRPSVNIITGIIKANFPARIAFRVMSKVDSRTILDMGGADQLIGRGDLILSIGSDSVRLQCPFVDTPEVDKVTDFIAQQPSYASAMILPEFKPDGEGGTLDEDEELDSYFADAARIVVSNDSGSTSMLQRKLSIGYNRAGRIMDQLERAGIVGPSNGSKPREVLYFDEMELEQYLESLL